MVDLLQRTIVIPADEVIVHRASRRKVLGNIAPLAARAEQIHDGVDHLTHIHLTVTATVLCRRDPRVALKPEDLNREWIVNARALHVDGYDTEAATVAAGWARAAGIPVIADLDELYPGVEKLLAQVDYLIVSRDIPCRLIGEPDLEISLRQMQRRYGCCLTAATLGDNGVLAWNGSQFYQLSAYAVPVVDTTGAGDIFHAGFIYGLLQNWPLERQLDFACAAAALNCTASGARGGIQSVEAIEKLMATGIRHAPAHIHCTAGSD